MKELPFTEMELYAWNIGIVKNSVFVAIGLSYVMPGIDIPTPLFMVPVSPDKAEKIARQILDSVELCRQQEKVVEAARKMEGQATVIGVEDHLHSKWEEKNNENQS